jgi:hypothetical protein
MMMMKSETDTSVTPNPRWAEAQKQEAEYWGNCLGMRAWGEFVKQEQYGREMGLFDEYGNGLGELEMRGKTVLDVGGVDDIALP